MKTIKKGDRGDDVKLVQKILHCIADGIFGIITDEAVRQFQKLMKLVVDGIVGPKTWAALGVSDSAPTETELKKSTRKINEILVHCTATAEGKDFDVEDIRRWHLAQGWADCGYHYVIKLDGEIQTGRPVDKVPASCVGHNTNSVAVVYVGGCAEDGKTPKDTRTKAQKESLLKLLKDLKKLYPGAKIHGHRDFANKACPSFDATKEYENL